MQHKRQIRQSITNLGTDDLRILYSPGYVIGIKYEDMNIVLYSASL